MSAFKVILHKISAVFFWIIALCRRLICFGRRRKKSFDLALENLEEVTTCHYTGTPIQTLENETELESWDSWKDQDNSGVSHNNIGVNSSAHTHKWRQKQEPEPEPEINFFEDMVPEVKKPPTIMVKKKNSDWSTTPVMQSSRLNIDNFAVSSEPSGLGTWEDDGTWEDEMLNDTEWDTNKVLREKKRMEREKRMIEQQKKKQEREMQRSLKSHVVHGIKQK